MYAGNLTGVRKAQPKHLCGITAGLVSRFNLRFGVLRQVKAGELTCIGWKLLVTLDQKAVVNITGISTYVIRKKRM